MSVSVAPRDTMVSTDLSALPSVSSSRLSRLVAKLRHIVRPVAANVCSHCEIGVVSSLHRVARPIDTCHYLKARNEPVRR